MSAQKRENVQNPCFIKTEKSQNVKVKNKIQNKVINKQINK